jgi:hypothetical protein
VISQEKCIDGASMGMYLEMLIVFKFITDTHKIFLKIRPKIDYAIRNLRVFCDRDWDGDPRTRISVIELIVYLQGAPVCWRSKMQIGVSLFSEAEYVMISDALKEINFLCCLLQDIGIEVEFPIVHRQYWFVVTPVRTYRWNL